MVEGKFNNLNCDCVSHFPRFPWDSAFFFFLFSTCLFMERMLFLLNSEWLRRHRKVWCGCTPKLLPCQSLCMAGFVWREGLRLPLEGHRALPVLVQRIAALNNSSLRNWTRVSCSGHVSVRLHTYSASWWATWAQLWGLMATAGSWMVATGTWWAQSCRDTHCPWRNEPQGRYLCCLATIWESHMWCLWSYLCAEGLQEGLGAPCASRRSAAPPVLSRWTEVLESLCSQGDSEQQLKDGGETLLCSASEK